MKIAERNGFEIHKVKDGYVVRAPDPAKPLKLRELLLVSELLKDAFHIESRRRRKQS